MQERNPIKYQTLIKTFKLLPGMIVKLTVVGGNGKGAMVKGRRAYEVVKDYGSHVLFIDVVYGRKLSLTKVELISEEVQFRVVKKETL